VTDLAMTAEATALDIETAHGIKPEKRPRR
jgi:hypothetical protein